jgi:hypothetical protein
MSQTEQFMRGFLTLKSAFGPKQAFAYWGSVKDPAVTTDQLLSLFEKAWTAASKGGKSTWASPKKAERAAQKKPAEVGRCPCKHTCWRGCRKPLGRGSALRCWSSMHMAVSHALLPTMQALAFPPLCSHFPIHVADTSVRWLTPIVLRCFVPEHIQARADLVSGAGFSAEVGMALQDLCRYMLRKGLGSLTRGQVWFNGVMSPLPEGGPAVLEQEVWSSLMYTHMRDLQVRERAAG